MARPRAMMDTERDRCAHSVGNTIFREASVPRLHSYAAHERLHFL